MPALAQPLDAAAGRSRTPALVQRAAAVRQHARPGDREAVASRSRARPSGRGPRASGGSGRRRRRRCRRSRPRPGGGRTCPRSTRRGRPRRRRPRSGTRPSRRRTGSRRGRPARGSPRLERGRVIPSPPPRSGPCTSQRWVAKKAIMTGSVETTPAAMSWAVLLLVVADEVADPDRDRLGACAASGCETNSSSSQANRNA